MGKVNEITVHVNFDTRQIEALLAEASARAIHQAIQAADDSQDSRAAWPGGLCVGAAALAASPTRLTRRALLGLPWRGRL